jgi:transcriptional regulator with XRE-family HTH domain
VAHLWPARQVTWSRGGLRGFNIGPELAFGRSDTFKVVRGERGAPAAPDLARATKWALDCAVVTGPGDRFFRERQVRRLTRQQVVDATGISLSTLKRIEGGQVRYSRAIATLSSYFDKLEEQDRRRARNSRRTSRREEEEAPYDPNDPPVSKATFLQLWARLYEVYREQTGDPSARFPLGVGEPPPERLLSDAYTVDEDELGREHREQPS